MQKLLNGIGSFCLWFLSPGKTKIASGLVTIALVLGISGKADARWGPTFYQLPGSLKQVSIADDHRIWGVNAHNYVFTKANPDHGPWIWVDGTLKQVAASGDGRVWGVNNIDDIYTRAGEEGPWQRVLGKLSQIAVNNGGRVWGVNSLGNVYTRAGVYGSWQYIPGGQFKQVSVQNSGRVWAIKADGRIYTRPGVNGNWEQVSGYLKQISAADYFYSNASHVWGVGFDGKLYYFMGTPGNYSEWYQMSEPTLKNISINTLGDYIGTDHNDAIWYREWY